MAESVPLYNRRVVRPIECLESGWALVKDRYWLFVGLILVGLLIGGLVPMGIIMGPMMCGIYLSLFHHMRGRKIEFGLLFKGFDYFVESLIATLLQLVPVLIILIPFYVVFFAGLLTYSRGHQRGGGNPPEPAAIAALISGVCVFVLAIIVVGLIVGVLFIFSYPLIVDRKLRGVQAVKVSIKAAVANFWGLLGLLALNALLSLVGALCCYVGAFLVLPLTFAALARAYEQVFGLAPEQPSPPPVMAPA